MKIRYSKKATTTGALDTLSAPADEVFAKFAIQIKGTGGVPTSWSVTLEGSLDGVNWTTLATHNANDGSLVQAVDKPCTHFRGNVGAVTLGPASDINVLIVGAP